jgi:hypothetical protein
MTMKNPPHAGLSVRHDCTEVPKYSPSLSAVSAMMRRRLLTISAYHWARCRQPSPDRSGRGDILPEIRPSASHRE